MHKVPPVCGFSLLEYVKSGKCDIARKEGDWPDGRCSTRAYRTYKRPHHTTLDANLYNSVFVVISNLGAPRTTQ